MQLPARLTFAGIIATALTVAALGAAVPAHAQPRGNTVPAPWSAERARAWYDSVGWVVGANYVPSTASNQLEMWQAVTWDPATIDRELGWAQSIGMNTMRVFLHDLLWQQDSTGFLQRMDEFLTIADRHRIRPMFVLFDAVWDPMPHLGAQRPPHPYLHNSAWVQGPGAAILGDSSRHGSLRPYVQGVVRRFASDRRVLAWDIFNEPDNINRPAYFVFEPRHKSEMALALMQKAFAWARDAGATQPLTAAPWKGDWIDTTRMLPISKWMLEQSDVISFHSYDPLPRTQALVKALERYGRPIIATEYMARPVGSTFRTHLPYFAQRRIGAINWGFVNGRSQTIYPWETWTKEYTTPPSVWFHDVFHTDGAPYDSAETALIRAVTRNPASAAATVAPRAGRPSLTRGSFGTLADGRAVELFVLRNARGTEVRVTNYGAIVTSIRTPDRYGRFDDIVLGFDTVREYETSSPYFGAVVGRVANRIARGRFSLDGKAYSLAVNNAPNALHGGVRGFDKVLWQGEPFEGGDSVGVTLRYTSPDGEEGYPGTLQVTVRYTLTARDELAVDYRATTDKATPVNLSQHTYWNLAGTGRSAEPNAALAWNGEHRLTLHASAYTPVDSTLIPTGVLAPVTGTPFDFRTPTAIGAHIDQDHVQLRYGRGYDHNWVIDRRGRSGLVPAARVEEPVTGRTLDVATTEPGVQFYAGNFLDGTLLGKAGRRYGHRSTVVLETQHYPDSPNHANFPSVTLRPGQVYRSRTVFSFGVTKP